VNAPRSHPVCLHDETDPSSNPSSQVAVLLSPARHSSQNNSFFKTGTSKTVTRKPLPSDHSIGTPLRKARVSDRKGSSRNTGIESLLSKHYQESTPSLQTTLNSIPDLQPHTDTSTPSRNSPAVCSGLLTSVAIEDNPFFSKTTSTASLQTYPSLCNVLPVSKATEDDPFFLKAPHNNTLPPPSSLLSSNSQRRGSVNHEGVMEEMPNFSTLRPRRMRSSEIGVALVENTEKIAKVDESGHKDHQFTLSGSPSKTPHVHFDQSDALGIDGSFSSPFDRAYPLPMRSTTAEKQLPLRSNSILSAQVQSFRKELKAKSDEIRHLKQKLNARNGTVEIVALNVQLKAANEEIRTWQSRAENAEKQLEAFKNLTNKTISRPHPHVGALIRNGSQPDLSGVRQTENGAVVVDRIRRALHGGLDGAVSFERTFSGESKISSTSSNTIIRSLAVTGSEYSIWAESSLPEDEDYDRMI